MIVNEDNIDSESNYDLLCSTIDNNVGKQYPDWKFSFEITDSTNGDLNKNFKQNLILKTKKWLKN